MAEGKGVRPARVYGAWVSFLGVMMVAGNLVALKVEHAYGPKLTVGGPIVALLGFGMMLFPGTAAPGPMNAEGAFSRMIRGLRRWDVVAWIAFLGGGVAIGVAWLSALDRLAG